MTDSCLGRLQLFRTTKRKELRSLEENCNRNMLRSVLVDRVDAVSITWNILMQARWWKLRSGTTMKQLANWFANSIRSWQKSFALIGRDAPQKRIFAK
ncbi:MAG: hypothetical protein ABI925_06245 [Verrucomicrobiota bacterium]